VPQRPDEDHRHPVVGDERVARGVLVRRTGLACAVRPGRRDGPRREHTGRQRLADALAGHRVGRAGGVADEQRPARVQARGVDAGRDGPGLVRRLRPRALAEDGAHVRPGEQRGPESLHVLHPRHVAAALDAEADVGATVRQGEGPRVAGQQVRFEPHEQVRRGRRADAGEVLPERVPLPEVPGLGGAEGLAQRRPHAVGADRVPRVDRADAGHVEPHAHVVLDRAGERVPVEHLHASGAREVEQRAVEIDAPRNRRERAGVAREREANLATRRRPHDDVVDLLPRCNRVRAQPERLELVERTRGQAVAAALVPREAGAVDQHHVSARARQRDGGRRAGGAAADDGDIRRDHRGLTPCGSRRTPRRGTRGTRRRRGWPPDRC
jgi:hypothetical protein